jgi:CRP-like cAMP-binding protein
MVLTYYTPAQSSSQTANDLRGLRFYERGENIPLIPAGLWQVDQGVVQLSKLTYLPGEEILLGWAKPANFFGRHLTMIDAYQAKALCDVYLRCYRLEEITQNPNLSQVLLQQLMVRMKQTEALLAIAGLRLVEEKLQELLKLLKQELSESHPEGRRIIVRLTHQNLASTIGTTRVTITRLLGEFQRQDWLKLDSDRHIIILNSFFD